MTTKKTVSWFLTEGGRTFSFYSVTGAGLTFACAKFCPNTFFINYYKDFVQYYINSKPAELSEDLQNRFQKCLDLLNIPDSQRKLVSPFSASGFDLFHAGSTKSKFGAIVGIPAHFFYKSINDIQKEAIKVNQKNIKWASETGQKLADAMILPEKVQEFAICREILSTQNYKVHFQSAFPFLSVLIAYNSSQLINRRMNLYAAPRAVRVTLYSLTSLFSIGLYFLLKDYSEVHYESLVDQKLCELGPDYIESGVIFYDKMLKRNQALRELMGKEGENKYSKLGNENFGLRHPRIALMHRKQFFESKLKELSNSTEEGQKSEA